MIKPSKPYFWGGMRECESTYRCYYIGIACRDHRELDSCPHKHKNEDLARACGRKLLKKWLKENGHA